MKFSIVTPSYNSAKYIRETIESVLTQKGPFEVEYHVQDGGSADETITILEEYDERVRNREFGQSLTFTWKSEVDRGMYDAINKGFSQVSGDVYAWINADDAYERDAFAQITHILESYPDIVWLKGTSSLIDESSKVLREGRCFIYRQDWLKRGVYGVRAYHVEQDSVFWRSSLWDHVHSIPNQYRLAGDYWLWTQFALYTKLWSVNVPISRFRKSPSQLSKQVKQYRDEQLATAPKSHSVGVFFGLWSKSLPFGCSWIFEFLYPIFFFRSVEYIRSKNGNKTKSSTVRFWVH